MDVEMLVRVHMIERETSRCERLELRSDFRSKLRADTAAQSDSKPKRRHVGAQRACVIDEIRYKVRPKQRSAFDKHEMQTDSKIGQAPGTSYRVMQRRAPDHQACCSENAPGVSDLDGFVHFECRTEIVCRDDDVPPVGPEAAGVQRASSRRSRRN